MKKTLFFIHGMFQNAKSWNNWCIYFSTKGYECIAESWPMHEGEPSDLRDNIPVGLGDLGLQQVIDHYASIVSLKYPHAVLVGHSVGGLVVQALLNQGMGSAGVCISSVAPNRMLAFDWSFFKNSISIANPLKGDEPFYMTADGFAQNFCNTMMRMEADAAYERTATHDSRNVLRDCMLEAGNIHLEKTKQPLLFIGGERDQIVPAALNKKNAEAYPEGQAEFKEYPNRGHFICGEPGWEDIAEDVEEWMMKLPVNNESISANLRVV